MELFLIRHGQSANNAAPLEQRVEDPALTELGRRQAEHSADWAESAGLTRLITSPFRRTLETTEAIHRRTGLAPEVWTDLHEQGGCVSGMDLSSFQGRPGMTHEQILADFPGYRIADEIDQSGWWKSKPYETWDEAEQRAEALERRTRDLFARTSERVAFVMHGNFKFLLVRALLPQKFVEDSTAEDIFNTSVTKITITPEQTRMEAYNSIDHLPSELIS